MNLRLLILLPVLFLFSCDRDENLLQDYSIQISFEVSKHLLSGKSVKTIEFTADGYYYSVGKEIFYTQWSGQTTSLSVGSDVLSMAFNEKNKSLYFGTYSTGLGKFDGVKTEYFTVENSGLPRNIISQVVCDLSGNVWFNSSAHKLGGLIKYDGAVFKKYLPENSSLPGNLIYQLKHRDGKIYVVAMHPEGGKATIEITGNEWRQLYRTGGCFMSDLDIDSNGRIYYTEDSREYCGGGLIPDEVVFVFNDGIKTMLRQHEISADMPFIIKTDLRDYVWVARMPSNQHEVLSVFDGGKWQEAPAEFPNDFIRCVEVDMDNNIWLGTDNGIYILNQ